MELVTGQFGQRQWTEIVSSFRDLSLVQTWEYGEAKSHTGPWKVERAIFVDGQQLVGAYQAMVRSIPYLGGGLVWINRGPLLAKTRVFGYIDFPPLAEGIKGLLGGKPEDVFAHRSHGATRNGRRKPFRTMWLFLG